MSLRPSKRGGEPQTGMELGKTATMIIIFLAETNPRREREFEKVRIIELISWTEIKLHRMIVIHRDN